MNIEDVTAELSDVPKDIVRKVITNYHKAVLVSLAANHRADTPYGVLEYDGRRINITSVSPLVESIVRADITLERALDLIESAVMEK